MQDSRDNKIDNLSSKVDKLYSKFNQLVYKIDSVLNRVDQCSTASTNHQATTSQPLINICSFNNPISIDHGTLLKNLLKSLTKITTIFPSIQPTFHTIAL